MRRTAPCRRDTPGRLRWFDAQEYDAAAKAFAELGSYEDAKQRVTASEDAWLSADYNSARMDTEVGNYAAVIDELAAVLRKRICPPRYAQMHDDV